MSVVVLRLHCNVGAALDRITREACSFVIVLLCFTIEVRPGRTVFVEKVGAFFASKMTSSTDADSVETTPQKHRRASIAQKVALDVCLGTSLAAVPVTLKAPYWRAAVLITEQYSIPDVRSGKVQPYRGFWDCLCRQWTDHGITSLWRGNLQGCLRDPPKQGAAFAFNDFAAIHIFPHFHRTTNCWECFGTRLASGAFGGAVAVALTHPFDAARVRRYAESRVRPPVPLSRGLLDCIVKTVRQEGILALYKGSSATFASTAVYRSVHLGCFSELQDRNPYRDSGRILSEVSSSFLAAAVSRTIAQPIYYPLDTIRRRLVLDSERPPTDRRFRGMLDCAAVLLKDSGLTGFYRGLVFNVKHSLISQSLVLVAYDRWKYRGRTTSSLSST